MPGGIKRNDKEINDNINYSRPKTHMTHSTKLQKDYNSNISCLPGTRRNTDYEKTKIVDPRKHQSSDIFNLHNPNSLNSFNRKANSNIRQNVFSESKEEKKLVPHPKSHRPDYIRNPFVSQIQII